MEVQFYKPSHETLKEYIEGFYFIKKREIAAPIKYLTFPNNYCIAAVYQHTDLVLTENSIVVSAAQQDNVCASLVSRYVRPIEIVQYAVTDEMTIYFKPLGINRFIDNVQALFKEGVTSFDPFGDYRDTMNTIFNTPDRQSQISQLEEYWLSKLIGKDFSFMEALLADVVSDVKINDIARKHHISRQYLNRIFVGHIGKSPAEFRKIHRFRSSISEKQNAGSLTALSHLAQFYDQSHFIRDFKGLTHFTPSDFFSKVDTEKENVWLVF
ncbi:AraC family transcriptional regulator [Chitinophaga oryzae]|uniref:AraC family transcriptional regulator n=1 Tax=Chitinophaga oryzae TaxID=2725414 RepID=A0ABX6LHU4_9BACT|nr:helix-turn-helix domain-containing protein [Chitinophaga oryzae]QJB39333.1 AraC family transcriptional regulator [Chitinophaga oryzae]